MANRYKKKTSNISKYQGDADQNHNEISSYNCWDGYDKTERNRQPLLART